MDKAMADHIEKKLRKFHAVLEVPRDVRGIIGKKRFKLSLKTDSETTAKRLAARLVPQWKLLIDAARAKLQEEPSDPIARDRKFLRDALQAQIAALDDAPFDDMLQAGLDELEFQAVDAAHAVERKHGSQAAQDYQRALPARRYGQGRSW